MITFAQLNDDITLDCDVEPKTRFRLRSLRYSDEAKIREAQDAAGILPPSALKALYGRWKDAGEHVDLTDGEQRDLDIYMARTIAREIKVCSLGVIEIDSKPVTPEEVEQMLDQIPRTMRDKVRTELASKIEALGSPDPKSGRPSE